MQHSWSYFCSFGFVLHTHLFPALDAHPISAHLERKIAVAHISTLSQVLSSAIPLFMWMKCDFNQHSSWSLSSLLLSCVWKIQWNDCCHGQFSSLIFPCFLWVYVCACARSTHTLQFVHRKHEKIWLWSINVISHGWLRKCVSPKPLQLLYSQPVVKSNLVPGFWF